MSKASGRSSEPRTWSRAAYVVPGTTSGVAAQLIRAADGAHQWSGTYDRNVSDALQLEAELAASLGRALELSVASSLASSPVEINSPEANDHYLRGLHALDTYTRTGNAGSSQSVPSRDCDRSAILRQPTYRLERHTSSMPNSVLCLPKLASPKSVRMRTEGAETQSPLLDCACAARSCGHALRLGLARSAAGVRRCTCFGTSKPVRAARRCGSRRHCRRFRAI